MPTIMFSAYRAANRSAEVSVSRKGTRSPTPELTQMCSNRRLPVRFPVNRSFTNIIV